MATKKIVNTTEEVKVTNKSEVTDKVETEIVSTVKATKTATKTASKTTTKPASKTASKPKPAKPVEVENKTDGHEKEEAPVITESKEQVIKPVADTKESDKATTVPVKDNREIILEVKNLKKHFVLATSFFGKPTSMLKAVDDVSFNVKRGTTMGIVGESGCGKTTLGRTILRLHEINGGQVIFDGKDITNIKGKELRMMRPKIQIIFQDPYSSLSPKMPIGAAIGEAVKVHKIVPDEKLHEYVLEIMTRCGLQKSHYARYPHEFSGGQRQRVCIARALALKSKFVVCDEPVSALDVSIQAQIINLLKDLQGDLGLSYLFISHDLSVVEHISDELGVMYLGNMMESGDKKLIFNNPLHPYTKALFSAVPVPDPKKKMNRIILKGDIPSPSNPPKGCKFNTRCSECMDICKHVPPMYKEYEPNHFVACHLYD